MNIRKLINKYEIAECIGLWLAEGDKRCNNEINFSNNCFNLIKQFHKVIILLFKKYKFNIRIYIYTKYGEKVDIPIKKCKINRYIDKQATRPYFIWRLASVELNKKWKKIVKEISGNKKYYADFLRGFFAGEGNIKTGSHNNRTIRISQGKPLELIESILKHFKIDYKYSPRERSYVIENQEILRKQYGDEFIAVKDSKVLSHNPDEFELASEIERSHRSEIVLIGTIDGIINPPEIRSLESPEIIE